MQTGYLSPAPHLLDTEAAIQKQGKIMFKYIDSFTMESAGKQFHPLHRKKNMEAKMTYVITSKCVLLLLMVSLALIHQPPLLGALVTMLHTVSLPPAPKLVPILQN